MNELKQLQSLGLTLPSPAYLLGAILFGIIGYVAYRRGKTLSRSELKWTGFALMVYPYAISETWILWAVGIALCFWLYAKWI
jgi:hypothetical protein